jgi:TPR repeat protein
LEKNEKEAFELFQKVAEAGYPSAQANLGVYYLEGRGVEKNLPEAEKWLLKAAQQGNLSAQFNLGVFYAKGTGGETNLVQAYKWSTLAASAGDQAAEGNRNFLLAEMTPKQIAEAIREASDFTFEKYKELRSEGILQIDPEQLKPIVLPSNVTNQEQSFDKAILPTEARTILDNPTEVQKAKDQGP